MEKFIKGMDAQQPDWWITLADPRDMIDCIRMCTDTHSGTVLAKQQLKRKTADRLVVVLRAAVECGLLKEVEE